MSKKLPKQLDNILTDDENIEKVFKLDGCKVYATNKRLVELAGRTIRDYDYTHISSIAYSSKRYFWLAVLGIVILVAGVYFGDGIDEIVTWASVVSGFLLIILGILMKSEWVEVSVVGVPNPVKYQGSRVILDSLLQIVRKKRLAGQVAVQKESKDKEFVETIRKLAELRDEGILTQEEFEERKRKLIRDSD